MGEQGPVRSVDQRDGAGGWVCGEGEVPAEVLARYSEDVAHALACERRGHTLRDASPEERERGLFGVVEDVTGQKVCVLRVVDALAYAFRDRWSNPATALSQCGDQRDLIRYRSRGDQLASGGAGPVHREQRSA